MFLSRRTLLMLAASAAILSAPAASAQDGPRVGVLVGLSGGGAQIGQWILHGAEAAAAQIQKSGGPAYQIVAEDSQWNPQKAVEGFNKLANIDEVLFVLAGGSAAMEAITPISTQRELAIFNTGAQSPNMAGIGPYVFSVLQLSDFDTKVLSRYAKDTLGYGRIATLYVNNDTGTFNQEAFSAGFREAGGEIVAAESFRPNETTYGVQVAKIRAASPDAIYIVGTPAELPFAVRQTRQMMPDTPILSYAGIESQEFLDAAGGAGDGIIYTTTAYDPGSEDQHIRDFVAAYSEKFGEVPTSPYAGYGYDALMIANQALQKSGGEGGAGLRDAIYEIRKFPGVTGENTFRDDGTVAKSVAIRKIENGAFTTIEIVEPQ